MRRRGREVLKGCAGGFGRDPTSYFPFRLEELKHWLPGKACDDFTALKVKMPTRLKAHGYVLTRCASHWSTLTQRTGFTLQLESGRFPLPSEHSITRITLTVSPLFRTSAMQIASRAVEVGLFLKMPFCVSRTYYPERVAQRGHGPCPGQRAALGDGGSMAFLQSRCSS